MVTVQILDKKRILDGKVADIKKMNVVWADFLSPSIEDIRAVSEIVGMKEEEIIDLLNEHTRPVLTNVEKYSVVIIQTPSEKEDSVTMPLLAFISKKSNDLITLHRHEMNAVHRVLDWTEKRKVSMFEKGTTFILYRVIDEISSSYSTILDLIDDKIDILEEGIYGRDGHKNLMKEAFGVKKKLIYFYKALTANRDVVSSIEKEYGMFLNKKDLSKFRLLYSDFAQLIDLTVTYRDILTTTIEVYLSMVSNSLNVTMKKLTAWGAIILLPTIISGIYGMNFKYLPEIGWKYGYLFALSIMATIVLSAYIYFKKKEWI